MKLMGINPVSLMRKAGQIILTPRDFKKIYVMGCGRSGTWLLAALFSTFRGVEVFPDEVPPERFATTKTRKSTLLMKRNNSSYQSISKIQDDIHIAWIIRHPFAVLTSHNPTTALKYHIKPERWLGEMGALQDLLHSNRPNTCIIRYEDLVADPAAVQAVLASKFGLDIAAPPDEITTRFKPSELAGLAMHGLRQIDKNSLRSYQNDPEKLDYLRSIRESLSPTLEWVAAKYSYDVTNVATKSAV